MTDDDLDRHIRAVIAREGGWVDDPGDSGGPTKYGVTNANWLAYNKDTRASPKVSLYEMTCEHAVEFYRWYFRTQGLSELVDEFGIQDDLVPLLMDMRTLHSVDGCREIMRDSVSMAKPLSAYVITLVRMRYMLQVAERRPKDRRFVRGWMHRALKAIGLWPPKPETREV